MATLASGTPPAAAASAPSIPIAAMPRAPLQRLVAAGQVPAGDVAELVGDHRPELVDRAELGHQPGVDEDVLPAGHEGVRLAVVDDVDLDRGRVDPGGAEERVRDPPQRVLDLGVADQPPRRRRSGRERHRHRQHARQEPQRRLLRPMAQARAAAASPATRGRGASLDRERHFRRGARPASEGAGSERREDAQIPPGRGRPLHRDGRDGGRPRRRGARALGDPHGGRPARHAGAGRRPRRARPRHGGGGARLHRGARAARAARPHRAALPRLVRGRPRPRPGGGDRRLVGRLHPRLHLALRARREGGDRRARATRATATSCARSTSSPWASPPGRRTASSRRPATSGPTSPACWWRAPPTRPAPCSRPPSSAR